VAPGPSPRYVLSLVTLHEVRAYVRRSHARMMAVFFSLAYALGAMVYGGMLIFAHIPGGYTTEILWGSGNGQQSWNYPALFIVAPWGVVQLPYFATLAMILVSAGVGLGMTVAILLTVELARKNKNPTGAGRRSAVGSAAGFTPAMLALVTLGACCSTTAAATAGIGALAQASGTTTDNLLLNNWLLGAFQIAIVWVALLAQELLLVVYGGIFGVSGTAVAADSGPIPHPPPDRRFAIGAALRIGLLAAGVTWALAVVAEWTITSPLSGTAALWFQWVCQHFLLAFLAIFAALFPIGTMRTLRRIASRRLGRGLRILLLISGVSVVTWVPPALAAGGVVGLFNEVFGALGLSAGWGALTPGASGPVAIALRWGFQFVLLSAFAIATALWPNRVLVPLLWSARFPRSSDREVRTAIPAQPFPPALTGPDSRRAPRPQSPGVLESAPTAPSISR
jgi:hypothetical protein